MRKGETEKKKEEGERVGGKGKDEKSERQVRSEKGVRGERTTDDVTVKTSSQ